YRLPPQCLTDACFIEKRVDLTEVGCDRT
ncbi:hypothetical protein LCGC14_2085900, partial [marine sediment metagenome]